MQGSTVDGGTKTWPNHSKRASLVAKVDLAKFYVNTLRDQIAKHNEIAGEKWKQSNDQRDKADEMAREAQWDAHNTGKRDAALQQRAAADASARNATRNECLAIKEGAKLEGAIATQNAAELHLRTMQNNFETQLQTVLTELTQITDEGRVQHALKYARDQRTTEKFEVRCFIQTLLSYNLPKADEILYVCKKNELQSLDSFFWNGRQSM
jgi:hypothetical protein